MDIEEVKANFDNKEFILNAVKQQGKFLEFASHELQDEREVVKAAL